MRDFNRFQAFCYSNSNEYKYLAFKGAFDRVENFQDHQREGHYMQLFYAIFDFYNTNPDLIPLAGVPAFDISANPVFFDAWCDFIDDDTNDEDGFTTASLKRNLSPSCGGNRHGGGGWSPIAKVLFPTVAVYMKGR